MKILKSILAMSMASLISISGFACDDIFKKFSIECNLQDDYLKQQQKFSEFSVDINQLRGHKLSQAFGSSDLSRYSNEVNDQTPEWQNFKNSQNYINKLNIAFLDVNDVLKMHSVLLSKNSLDKILNTQNAGKLRLTNNETNPTEKFNCENNPLTEEAIDVIENFDLKSEEGYPLLTLQNIAKCKIKGNYSGEVVYYKGASMRAELNHWITDFNDMLARIEFGGDTFNTSPYQYLSEMRRWFLALKPFTNGNEVIINTLLDYATVRLHLPSVPYGRLNNSIFQTKNQSTKELYNELKNQSIFNSGCLFEHSTKNISMNCRPI